MGLSASWAAKPNIILIMADDLGYGDLSCYPALYDVQTPHIDRLAETGVRMTQAYSAGPVCSPTRASLLTGKFPQRAGVYGNYDGATPGVGPFRDTFPQLLQQAGYRTAWFGKWHQGWDVSNHPLNNGFDVAFGYLGGMHDYFDSAEGDHYIGGPFAPHAFVLDGFKPVLKMDYFTTELNNRAMQFVRETKDQPFFIYLAHSAPHTPIQAPDEVILKYLKPGGDPVAATRRAMIDVLDESVGQLMATLKREGLLENTLVVFTSDNGAEHPIYNGGMRGTKMTAWEGATRVPLITSWPDALPAGKTVPAICSTPDLTATFLELAEADAESLRLDGVSLMPFWTEAKTGNAHDGLVWSVKGPGGSGTLPTTDNVGLLAVRLGDWKLSRDVERGVDALYNLAKDPSEQTDVSESYPEKRAALLAYGAEFFKTCAAGSGRIANKDTRKNGNEVKTDALRKRCQHLLSEVYGEDLEEEIVKQKLSQYPIRKEGNLIQNGAFSELKNGLPQGWTQARNSAFSGIDTQAYASAPAALYIADKDSSIKSGGQASAWLSSDKIGVEEEASYNVSWSWKYEDANNVAVMVGFWDRNEKFIGQTVFKAAGSSPGWVAQEKSVKAPKGARLMKVIFASNDNGTGNVWLDDVGVKRDELGER
jgi:arylsulfatase A